MSSLVQILFDEKSLLDKLAESGGEIDGDLEILLSQTELAKKDKVDAVVCAMDRIEETEKRLKEYADKHEKAAKTLKALRERIKERLKWTMKASDMTKIDGNEFTMTLSKDKERVAIDDTLIQDSYRKPQTKMVPDKEKIESDIRAGLDVPGASIEKYQSLTIRIKK